MKKRVQIGTKPSSKAKKQSSDLWVKKRVAPEGEDSEANHRLTIDLPVSLHKQFKSDCALRGVKMSDDIREFLASKYRKS